MGIQRVVQAYLPLVSSRTAAEVDAEIREELEFHLEMRTRDNMRAGMSADEARRDAQQRFGDFEASRRACRQIVLGPKLMLQRIQTPLLVVLLCAVVYLGARQMRLQRANRDQIELLTTTIQQLQGAQDPVRNAGATIPFVQWKLDPPNKVETEGNRAEAGEPVVWSSAYYFPDQPWSDWGALENVGGSF